MKRFLASVLTILLWGANVFAARLPDKVSRNFTIEGAGALKVASALGMSTERDNSLSLPWKRNNSRCYTGVDAEGKAVYQPCDPNPAPLNVIKFSIEDGKPKLEFYGIWFDGETGSLPDVPRYSFSSPLFLSGEDVMGWQTIKEKLGEAIARSKDNAVMLTDDEGPLVQVSSITTSEDLQLTISMDDRTPAARMLARQRYLECLDRLNENPIDSGC